MLRDQYIVDRTEYAVRKVWKVGLHFSKILYTPLSSASFRKAESW